MFALVLQSHTALVLLDTLLCFSYCKINVVPPLISSRLVGLFQSFKAVFPNSWRSALSSVFFSFDGVFALVRWRLRVCWNCEVWVCVAFAARRVLSLCACAAVCCIERLISLTVHSLSYTHNAHACVRTQRSWKILLHTHALLNFFLKCLQTLKYLLPPQVMHDLI